MELYDINTSLGTSGRKQIFYLFRQKINKQKNYKRHVYMANIKTWCAILKHMLND